MQQNVTRWIAALLLLQACNGERTFGQFKEEETVRAAGAVLNEAMATPGNAIPQSMLSNAWGVAIIPNVIKGSFVIGARHGRGVLFVREPNGVWHAPVFVTLTGGNVGWQVGVQSSDIVLVFKTQKSVNGLLAGKLTLGADAAAAAGPVGRQGSIGTDGRLQAEVYSYSRSRGLFAGVSIDGSVISVDQLATGSYYKAPAPGQPVVVPPTAAALTQQIATLTSAEAPKTLTTGDQSMLAHQHSVSEADVLRTQLTQLAPELFEILDPQWKAFLALPENVLSTHPDPAALQATLQRYNTVALDGRYTELASRPEFQSVYGLLRHYAEALSPSTPTLNLPAPPPGGRTAVLPP